MTDIDKAVELIARALINAQLIALERHVSGIPADRSLNLPYEIQEEAAAIVANITPMIIGAVHEMDVFCAALLKGDSHE